MSAGVAVTSWAVWTPASGPLIDPLHEPPAPVRRNPGRAHPVPVMATTLVQLAGGVLTSRRARAAPSLPDAIDIRLGTQTGSRRSDLDFIQSMADRGEAFGSPSLFAYTLSTAAVGEVALSLGLRGSLATMSSAEVSGLAAVVTGAAAVGSGRSAACLCGAMEMSGSAEDVLALFLLEPAASDLQAPRLVDWELRFDPPPVSAPVESLRSTMERLAFMLRQGGGELAVSCPGGAAACLTVVSTSRTSAQAELLAGMARW